jgi:hypothetical protein
MPPEPMMLRSSNCRNCIGTIIECPHLLHGTVVSGARSLETKTFVSHHPHVTIRNGSLIL